MKRRSASIVLRKDLHSCLFGATSISFGKYQVMIRFYTWPIWGNRAIMLQMGLEIGWLMSWFLRDGQKLKERYPRIDFRRRASKEYIHGQKETQRSLKSRGGWHLLSNKPRFFDFLVIWVSNRVQLWSYCGNFRRKTDKLATTFSLWQTG